MPAGIEVILLAAGRSARMAGTDKRLLAVAGEPMLRRAARLWSEAGHVVWVVTRTDDPAAAEALAGLPVTPVANADADLGQHTSVLAGLAAAPLAARAVAIALADQPLLTAADIAALIATFDAHAGTDIIIPRQGERRGNPVLLPAAIARQLRETARAPRAFIDANPALVHWHEAANDHFTTDLDTPEDAHQVLGRLLDPEPTR